MKQKEVRDSFPCLAHREQKHIFQNNAAEEQAAGRSTGVAGRGRGGDENGGGRGESSCFAVNDSSTWPSHLTAGDVNCPVSKMKS